MSDGSNAFYSILFSSRARVCGGSTAAAAGSRGRARRGRSRRSPRAGWRAPSARAAAASVEVKPERPARRAGGRAGGQVSGWRGRQADGRANGRRERAGDGGAGGRDVGDSARGQQQWRCAGSGSGPSPSPSRREVERMSMFKVAMVWWMMSERMMTAGSRRRGHDARGTAWSTCVGAVRRVLRRRARRNFRLHARFYPRSIRIVEK